MAATALSVLAMPISTWGRGQGHQRCLDLTETARATLREIIAKNQMKRRWSMHASILLKADRPCGGTNAAMAAAYEVATQNVEQRKKRVGEEGVDAALSRQPVRKSHRRHIPEDAEAPGIALGCRKAPAGQKTWTLRRRAATMVTGEMSDAVSQETVRRTVKTRH